MTKTSVHNYTDYDARRNHIIEVATKAFHNEGIRNVTMDHIAHTLTMSKRTLYQLFSDKEDLLLACAMKREQEEHALMEKLNQQTDNVLDHLLATFALRMREMDEIKPDFFTEIVKYPRVIRFYDQAKKEREAEAVEFLNKGIKQGFFRANVNFHIVYNQLCTGLSALIANADMGQYSQRELFCNTVIPYVRGCATIKGIEIIDRFMDKYDTQMML